MVRSEHTAGCCPLNLHMHSACTLERFPMRPSHPHRPCRLRIDVDSQRRKGQNHPLSTLTVRASHLSLPSLLAPVHGCVGYSWSPNIFLVCRNCHQMGHTRQKRTLTHTHTHTHLIGGRRVCAQSSQLTHSTSDNTHGTAHALLTTAMTGRHAMTERRCERACMFIVHGLLQA